MRALQGRPWSIGDMIKMLLHIVSYIAITFGLLILFGVLIGVYIGILAISYTVRAYNQAAELAKRIRLANFAGRN